MFYSFFKRICFIIIFCLFYIFLIKKIFTPIFLSNNIIIPYAVNPFNICETEPLIWEILKKLFVYSNIIISFLLSFLISKLFFSLKIFHKRKSKNYYSNNSLNIYLGTNNNKDLIYISEKSLYQNILITGSIGSGKTSSAMYPLTKQLIEYKKDVFEEKIGMLILDVKGNYYSKVLEFSKNCNRQNDLIVIDLNR